MENSRRILIVDDDPRICSLLRRYLELEGYRIDSAASGEEMRKKLAEVKFDLVLLDLLAQELTSPEGTGVLLTTREFELLAALVDHGQRVLSRDSILALLCGRDWTPIDRSIDVLIGKLRKKLGDDGHNPELIKTVRGVGYKLASPVEFS